MNVKPVKSFQDLIVWQKAYKFVLSIYLFSEKFPNTESRLISQLRRSAISLPANIAESFHKQTRSEKVQLQKIAENSIDECRYYLIVAKELAYGDIEELMSQLAQVAQLLTIYYDDSK